MFNLLIILFALISISDLAFAAKCYVCTSIVGDCSDKTCDGNWCVARIMLRQSPETNIYTKECSSTNPNINSKIGNCIKKENGDTTGIVCGCQSDFCNSADSIRNFLENSTNSTRDSDSPFVAVSNLSNMSKTLMQKQTVNYSNILQNDNGQSVSCFECNSVKGDCVIGDCKGHWCKTTISQDSIAGTKVVSKGCSTTHPNSVTYDGCVKVISQAVTTISCGCRKSNFCNTEQNVEAWLARPVPSPGNSSAFESFVNANDLSTEISKTQHAKRRCHCTKGSIGCSNGECYGEMCAWTTFLADKTNPSGAAIGKVIHQYCAPSSLTTKVGCDNPEYKVVNSPADRAPTETTSRTCHCDFADFCNKSSSLLYSPKILFLLFIFIILSQMS